VIEQLPVKQKDLYSLYDTRNFVFGKHINMNIPINYNTVTFANRRLTNKKILMIENVKKNISIILQIE